MKIWLKSINTNVRNADVNLKGQKKNVNAQSVDVMQAQISVSVVSNGDEKEGYKAKKY